jgi:hypothetical protein
MTDLGRRSRPQQATTMEPCALSMCGPTGTVIENEYVPSISEPLTPSVKDVLVPVWKICLVEPE